MLKNSRLVAVVLLAAAFGSPLAAPGSRRTRVQHRSFRPSITTGVADTSMFAPLNLPTGNMFRSGSGMPGPKYWQQRADYDLHGTLDTAAKALRGEMTLRYTNNSPDTLRFVWFQVEQNAFKNGSLNSYVFPRRLALRRAQLRGRRRTSIGSIRSTATGEDARSKTRVEGTVMKVDLAAPLAPGQTATFDVAWHFNIPEHGADRMGREGCAVRARAVVSARLRLRRPARLEHRAVPRAGRVLSRVRRLQPLGHRARRLHRGRDRRAAERGGGADADADRAIWRRRRSPTRTVHIITAGGAEERRRAPEEDGHADLAVHGAERARRRVGRVARLHVGRVELEGAHGVRLLPPERDRDVEGRRRHVAHVDHGILGALVPVSVSADQRGRGTDQRHGVPDGRDGEQERRQVRAVQRRHARDRAHVVSR